MLPAISTYDPPEGGEGSLDPMGLAAMSDRLADQLVPGLRARMRSVRFVTAIAVGSLACEPLTDQMPADGVSTPAICFEWLVLEAFVRRIGNALPTGVPGSLKTRNILDQGGRLSATTYLKSPGVFGFNGVYKPFASASRVVEPGLEPGPRAAELVRAWEADQRLDGFVDQVPGSAGDRLRRWIHDEVDRALREGRCATSGGAHVFGELAQSLRPDAARRNERRALRSLLTGPAAHPTRAELARLLQAVAGDDSDEARLLAAVRPHCSAELGALVDAVLAYEELAAMIDAAFRTLCTISYAIGDQPMTVRLARDNPTIVRCAAELPGRYRTAVERIGRVAPTLELEERLGAFAIHRGPGELVELLLDHHERTQQQKPPNGKLPWFEPYRDGWLVRPSYGTAEPPQIDGQFIHPVRVDTLRRFMEQTGDA